MKKLNLLLLMILVYPLTVFAESVTTAIVDNSGKKIGTLELVEGTKGVLLKIKASGLSAGAHGMHIHAVGDCSDHEAFKNCQGHVDQSGKLHGFLNPQGAHDGDLPNLIVAADGSAEVVLYSETISLSANSGRKSAVLRDADGSALVIHAEPDDYNSQPIGGAGSRVACAVIESK